MKKIVFDLFNVCFPEYPLPFKKLMNMLNIDECSILSVRNSDVIVGISVVHANRIRLICVHPKFQNKGYGTQLVKLCETEIKLKGYKKVILGGGDSELFIGAVTGEEDFKNNKNLFFQKLGYKADEACFEMRLSLAEFSIDKFALSCPPDTVYKYYIDTDKKPLIDAVADVDESWVNFFQDDSPVFCGFRNGKPVSFATLSFDDDNILCRNGIKVGSIGCVGTVNSQRGRGIGLLLVAHATNELKKHGCAESFIHWTYLDNWYGKLGYKKFMWYWFGEKNIE